MNFNGISYTFTTPYNPATNSQAECTVHGFKEAIKVKVNGTILYSTTGASAKLLFKHHL